MRRFWIFAFVLSGLVPASSPAVRVTPVVADGRVYASFTAPTAYGDDTERAVQTGLPLTFTFLIDLRRPSTIWFDRTIGSATVSSSVKFDNLTHVYQVSKLNDGRVYWSQTTDKADQARSWATAFDRVPLVAGEPLEPNSDYYVRVRVLLTPRRSLSLWSLWPFGGDDGAGRADFTFIR